MGAEAFSMVSWFPDVVKPPFPCIKRKKESVAWFDSHDFANCPKYGKGTKKKRLGDIHIHLLYFDVFTSTPKAGLLEESVGRALPS